MLRTSSPRSSAFTDHTVLGAIVLATLGTSVVEQVGKTNALTGMTAAVIPATAVTGLILLPFLFVFNVPHDSSLLRAGWTYQTWRVIVCQ